MSNLQLEADGLSLDDDTSPARRPLLPELQLPWALADAAGRLQAIGPAMLRLLGGREAEWLGRPIQDWLQPEPASVLWHAGGLTPCWREAQACQAGLRVAPGAETGTGWQLTLFFEHHAQGRPRQILVLASPGSRPDAVVPARPVADEDLRGKLQALGRSQAIIEFDLQGNVLVANHNFLRALGYTEAEVMGRHHSLFCVPEVVKSAEYRNF